MRVVYQRLGATINLSSLLGMYATQSPPQNYTLVEKRLLICCENLTGMYGNPGLTITLQVKHNEEDFST